VLVLFGGKVKLRVDDTLADKELKAKRKRLTASLDSLRAQ